MSSIEISYSCLHLHLKVSFHIMNYVYFYVFIHLVAVQGSYSFVVSCVTVFRHC